MAIPNKPGRRAARRGFPTTAVTIGSVVAAIGLVTAGTVVLTGSGGHTGVTAAQATSASNSGSSGSAAMGGMPSSASASASTSTSASPSPTTAAPAAGTTTAAPAPAGKSSTSATSPKPAATTNPPPPATTLSIGGLSTAKLTLGTNYSYLQAGYNEVPQWQRMDTAAAPDGHLIVAWQGTDGVHVMPLDKSGQRTGSDAVVPHAQEISGLVAFNDGFAVLTRLPDTNKWGDTAAYLLRYRGSFQQWSAKLTGTASNDTAPVLDGALRWDGSRFGAYFVVHGAGGFADGHYGDKLVYVDASGNRLSGGWDWGCSHNEGIALWPTSSGAFASLCGDDWRSGIFVSTGISAPDEAPVIERLECWAGYCGGVLGGLVRSPSGQYATICTSRGDASAAKNPADSSGRGWSVTSKWPTHQIAVSFLTNAATPTGQPVYLTADTADDHVNAHIVPYGPHNYLVSWETVTNPKCTAGTCTGTFAGTHVRVIDSNGRFVTPDLVVQTPFAGDPALLPDGSIAWTGPNGAPSAGVGATTGGLTVAVLRP